MWQQHPVFRKGCSTMRIMHIPRFRATAAAVTVVTLAALSTACGSDSGSGDGEFTPTPEPGTGTGAADAEQGSAPEELDFTTRTVDGKEFKGAALAGESAVMWFWAPWCTVCASEAPAVRKAAEEHGDEVAFVGIPGKGEVAQMRTFVSDHRLGGFQHAVDTDGALWSKFGVSAQPATAFIDKTGKVEVVPGTMSASELNKRVADLAGR
jgi:peroxiredoxin